MTATIDYKKLGKRVKLLRKEHELTQERLAEACDISVVYVSHIENGTARPSLEVLLRLAGALNTTPDYFLLDTRFKSGEYIKAEIAKYLEGADEETLYTISRIVAVLTE